MRVLHIYHDFFPKRGGIEDHILSLCRNLSAEFRPAVLSCSDTLRTVSERSAGVPVTRCGQIFRVLTPVCPMMGRALTRAAPDLIHLHLPCPMGVLAFLLARTRTPLIISYHNDIVRPNWLYFFYRPLQQLILRRAKAIIGSTTGYAATSTALVDHRRRLTIIPYGIELDRFAITSAVKQHIARIERTIPSPRILFVGRLCYYKGIEHLLPAMKRLDAHLTLIGRGPWEKRLKSIGRRPHLADKVHFVGQVDDEERAAWYHTADVVVLPSTRRSEAFGLVQLEAMACGKPIVSTDLPGVSQINMHGVTGLTIPAGSSRAIADAVQFLLDNPQLRRQLGERAHARVQRRFQVKQMVSRIEAVYRQGWNAHQ